LEEFDKNTDVLYYLVSDELVGDKTFRELLVEASSEEEISKIERNVPLLNIYNVRVDALNVFPENLDVEDNEIPVAVSMPDSTYLYFDGAKDCGLAKGEVPGFNLFVVGLNACIDAKSISIANNDNYRTKDGLKRATAKTVMFKSPEFDGRESRRLLKDPVIAPTNVLGYKATAAQYFFYKDDNSIKQIAFQRDYIYYGIRPDQPKGSLNNSVSEYLAYIEIDPATYFKISDDKNEGADPYMYKEKGSYSQKRHPLSEAEQIDKFWTQGYYIFKFDIIKSTGSSSTSVYAILSPSEIWDFKINYEETKATRWRHSKHAYSIDVNKFEAKHVFLNPIDLGKWHISNEALTRTIIISEEDAEQEITETHTYEVRKAKERNFKGNLKVNIGLKASDAVNLGNVEGGISAEANNNTTTAETVTVTTRRNAGSDPLGSVEVYFYDPIILKREGNDYILKTYTTGPVTFGIVAK
jgi:hypothetical protein